MSVVLITGCSTGIGFATAELMARSGHTVFASMRNPCRAPELGRLAERDSLPITILTMDVDSDESVRSAVAAVLDEAGHIDVLVNNAGILPIGPLEERPFSEFEQVMQTNYFGALRCIRAVLPSMRDRRQGVIISVSSLAGKLYSPFHCGYCASKAAVEAMSESLATELGPFGIRVALVQPGMIDTPLFDKFDEMPADTYYPNQVRLAAFMRASRSTRGPASVVAQTIEAIANGEQTTFRNPVGAEAGQRLAWRSSVSDEDWIASGLPRTVRPQKIA